MQLLKEALAEMDYQNQLPDTRCRELSLAITNAEQAENWMERAMAKQAAAKEGTD